MEYKINKLQTVNCLLFDTQLGDRYTKRPFDKGLIELKDKLSFLSFGLNNLLRTGSILIDKNLRSGYSFNPKSITFRVTTACNLKCKMCHFVGLSGRYIDPSVLRNTLRSIRGIKPYIILTGGEPLLHPEIIDMIKEAKKQGFFVLLVSNGFFLRDKAEEIVHSGLDVLVISLDGVGEVHDIIRGKVGLFERVIEGIKTLSAVRKTRGINWFSLFPLRPAFTLDDLLNFLRTIEDNKRGGFQKVSELLKIIEDSRTVITLGPRVYVNCTLNPLNVEDLVPLYSLVSDLGVDGINYQHIWLKPSDHSYDFDSRLLDRETKGLLTFRNKWEEIGSRVYQVGARMAGLSFMIPSFFFPRLSLSEIGTYYSSPEQFVGGRKIPYCAWFYANVDSCGKLVQCGDLVMEDLRGKSFGHAWNSKDYREFRISLEEKGVLPNCSRCCYYFRRIWM